MKRSPMPRRKTEMARGPGPRRDADGAKAWAAKPHKPIAQVSSKRRAQAPERADARAIVLELADGACAYAPIIPEVPACEGELEVDELRGGSRRGSEWLDPTMCRAPCRAHHRWKTDHKVEVLFRLALYEGLMRGKAA